MSDLAEEHRDKVLEGRIALKTFEIAAKEIPDDAEFLCSLLAVAYEFPFARKKTATEDEESITQVIEK